MRTVIFPFLRPASKQIQMNDDTGMCRGGSNRRPRLLVVSSFLDSPIHADRAPYTTAMLQALSDDWDIRCIRPVAWTDVARSARIFYAQREAKQADYAQYQYPLYWFLPGGHRPSQRIGYSNAIRQGLAQYTDGWLPDVIYTTWTYPDAFCSAQVAKALRVPYVMRVHGTDINELPKDPALASLIASTLSEAANVICPSQALADKVQALGTSEKNIVLQYSAVDSAKFKPAIKSDAELQLGLPPSPRVLYVGNLKQQKGVLDLLSASALIDADSLQLVIVGAGPAAKESAAIAAKLPARVSVKFIGPVAHDALGSFMNAADVLCLPSYSEGVPNVVLEALACQCKVVASNVGGIPEVLGPSTCLVEPGNVQDLAAKLTRALFDENFESHCRIQLQGYSSLAIKFSALLTNAVNNKKSITDSSANQSYSSRR